MINVEVSCRTILEFTEGNVSGYIVISPESILDALMQNVYLSYSIAERASIMKLISKENHNRDSAGIEKSIKLTSGVVDRNYVQMPLHDAIDFLSDYLHINDVCKQLGSLSKDMKMYLEDFLKMQSYVYRCDDCSCLADTANVKF